VRGISKKPSDKKNGSGGRISASSILALVAVLSLLLNFYQVYQGGVTNKANLDLVQSNLRLQQLQLNYTSRVFGYAPEGTLQMNFIPLNPSNGTAALANGTLSFTVVVISPHYGYATINQSYFNVYEQPITMSILSQSNLRSDIVRMQAEPILSVVPGAFEGNLELHFLSVVVFSSNIARGALIDVPIGAIGITITFYDVQTNTVTTTTVEISLMAHYVP